MTHARFLISLKLSDGNVTDNGSYATVPQQDKQMIESFFDNGIRFWRTSSIEKLSQIGNYDVDNSAIE